MTCSEGALSKSKSGTVYCGPFFLLLVSGLDTDVDSGLALPGWLSGDTVVIRELRSVLYNNEGYICN